MIVFYNKKDGRIVGTIDGRIHGKEHLDMWIGSDKNNRIVVNWKKYKSGYHPSIKSEEQKKVFEKLDKKPGSIYDYKVDVKTKNLVKIKQIS